MATLKTLFPTLASQSDASSNRTRIQALLDVGGDCSLIGNGTAFIDAPLVIRENTHLHVDPKLEIKQKDSSNRNLLQNAAYQRAWAGVTVAWTSGLSASVSWTAHGRAVDEYVWIRGTPGTTDSALIGVFKIISVTNANAFVVALRRVPAATGSGTMEAKLCDRNIKVSGGVWNYNNTANTATDPLERHAIVLAGIAGLDVRDIYGTDAQKYVLCLGGVRDFLVDGFHPFDTNSDGLKIYGPAFDGKATRLIGAVVDDGVSVQTREPVLYAAYDFTQGGDILDVEISNVRMSGGTTSGAVIYMNPHFLTDNVTIDGVSYQGAGYSVRVDNNDGTATSSAGTIRLRNIEQCGTATNTIAVITSGSDLTIARLEIDDFMMAANAAGGTAINVNYVDPGVTVKELIVDGGTLRFARNDLLLAFAGIAESIVIRDMQSLNTSDALGRLLVLQANCSVKKVNVEHCDLNKLDSVVNVAAMTEVPHISVVNNQINLGSGSVISLATNATVYVAGNRADKGGLAGGFVRVNGAAVVVNVHSGGGNLIPAGKWVVKINGGETVNLFADDFQVDVSAVARVNGGRCWNTNAALGTLATVGPVDCLGTAANSWRRRGDYSLQY